MLDQFLEFPQREVEHAMGPQAAQVDWVEPEELRSLKCVIFRARAHTPVTGLSMTKDGHVVGVVTYGRM